MQAVRFPSETPPPGAAEDWAGDWAGNQERLVPVDRLRSWMDGQGLGRGPLQHPVALQGGTQNILLRFVRDGRSYVLRRPPPNPYLDGDKTIQREIRVLGALADTDVPHARLVAACLDREPLGSAFYLMEAVDGFAATRGMPDLHAGDADVQHAMGLEIVDALARLQAVDPAAVGLDGFGRPEGFLERQASRWLRQLDSYDQYAGWDGRRDLAAAERLAAWLDAHLPRDFRPAVVHGDFHVGNLLFSHDGAALLAIVDWELATIGDPLIDLGCLLATWTDPDGSHPGCLPVEPWLGFPTEAELVERYAALTGRDMTHYNWFVVLACFKLGILQEGSYARACGGLADMGVARWMHETSINLFQRALGRIQELP
ncbi:MULTISPECIES: phosphotransferase family protein [Sphingobium]|uniref:phosphotransferase family protein n=1 Tax=Sphingobium TaxID=165695 RepID=UPI0020A55F90|nr:phosphotransferase family protein [Sphingobium indicum]